MDKKRVLLAFMFIAATLGIGFALYFFFFRTPPVPSLITKTPAGIPPELPRSGEGKPGATVTPVETALPAPAILPTAAGGLTRTSTVTDHTAVGLTAVAGGSDIAYYDANEGLFYKVDPTGGKVKLSDERFFNVKSVAWTPDQKKAALEFPDGYNVIYDFAQKKQMTLPTHWEQFQFSQNGTQIAAISKGIHESQNWLLVMNADGTNAKGIEPLGKNADKVIVSWNAGGEIVGFSKTGDPVGGEASEVFLLGQHNENFKSLIVDGFGFKPKWAPDGTSLLYSTHSSRNEYKPMIWIVDASGAQVGANRRELGVNTWADKCVVQDKFSVICAVPNELPKVAGVAPQVAKDTPDTFYKIDTATGLKTKLAIPDIPVNATNLTLSNEGDFLYYQNKFSGAVEKIKLK